MNYDDLRNYFRKTSGDDDFKLARQATEEICNFLEQYIEKLDENEIMHAFCLLVQIGICSRDNPQSTRAEVELLYHSLAVSSETSILEFCQLGEAVTVISRLAVEYGTSCLQQCRMTIPFCENGLSSTSQRPHSPSKENNRICARDNSLTNGDSAASRTDDHSTVKNTKNRTENNKVVINVSTLPHLFAMQRFWSNVLLNILLMKFDIPIPFSLPRCLQSLCAMLTHSSILDAPPSTISSITATLLHLLEDPNHLMRSSVMPLGMRTTAALDVLRWTSGMRIPLSSMWMPVIMAAVLRYTRLVSLLDEHFASICHVSFYNLLYLGVFKKLSSGLDRRDLPPLSSIVAEEMISMADILPNFFHVIVRDDPTAAEIVGLKIVEMLETSVTENHGLLTVPQTLTGICVCVISTVLVWVCVCKCSDSPEMASLSLCLHSSLSRTALSLSVLDASIFPIILIFTA